MKLVKSLVITTLLSMIAMSVGTIATHDAACDNMHMEADKATSALLHRILYNGTYPFHK